MVAETDTSLLDRDEATAAGDVCDDAGNRVAETVATGGTSVASFYLSDTQNHTGYAQPVEVWTSADDKRSDAGLHETYLLGDRVPGQVDASVAASVAASYLLTDGHGSTRQLTDAAGLVTHAFTYDAFGTALNFDASSAPTVFLFGGDAVYDPASGLYMHGNGVRDRLGFEFIQRDTYAGNTSDPISLHKYLYAGANPINASDPSGDNILSDLLSAAIEGDGGDPNSIATNDNGEISYNGGWLDQLNHWDMRPLTKTEYNLLAAAIAHIALIPKYQQLAIKATKLTFAVDPGQWDWGSTPPFQTTTIFLKPEAFNLALQRYRRHGGMQLGSRSTRMPSFRNCLRRDLSCERRAAALWC